MKFRYKRISQFSSEAIHLHNLGYKFQSCGPTSDDVVFEIPIKNELEIMAEAWIKENCNPTWECRYHIEMGATIHIEAYSVERNRWIIAKVLYL